jgi:hypothetical protein
MSLTKDFTIVLENRPGKLAEVGEALGNANVNIDGVCGFHCKGSGVIHILAEDADGARKALETAGLKITKEQKVLLIGAEDHPGELGRISRLIADARVNIDLVYLSMKGEVVVAAEDLDKVRSAVESAGGEVELM